MGNTYQGIEVQAAAAVAAQNATAAQTAGDAEFTFTFAGEQEHLQPYYKENSIPWEMSHGGAWEHERVQLQSSYHNRTCSFSKQKGAAARYAFARCEGLRLYGPACEGEADITLDGKPAAHISCAKGGCLYESGALPAGPHTLEVTVASGRVGLDKLEADGEPAEVSFIENGNKAFVYTTVGFQTLPTSNARSQSLLSTGKEGEILEIYFSGSFIRLYGEKGPEYGQFSLRLNGKEQILSANAPQKGIALLFEAKGLGEGYHALRIETKGPFALDGAEVGCAVPLMTWMNKETDLELAEMRRYERETLPPEAWQPVSVPFAPPQSGVELQGGLFGQAFTRNIKYLLDSWNLPYWVDNKDDDRIWVDMLVASNEGRMLAGMGNTLRFQEVPEFRERIKVILEAVERRQFGSGNGYLMPYDSTNYAISKHTWPGIMRDEQKNYDRAMFTKGMLAVGAAGITEVYPILRQFYNWYNTAREYLPIMLLGSMGIQGSVGGPRMYFSPVGTSEDLSTSMRYYDMRWWLEALGKKYPEAAWRFTLNRPHNYLLTSIHGLLLTYIATGEKQYLEAVLGAWHIYRYYFMLPGGGMTLCEHHECLPWSHKITNRPVSVFETCGNEFWMELNSLLLRLFPEEKYATEIEESLYNFLLASQAEDGKIRYFNQPNASKFPAGRWNTCCEIQATMFFGALPEYIFSLAEDAIRVNLFAPAAVTKTVGETPFKLSMQTNFPFSPEVTLQVACEKPVTHSLQVRVPGYVTGQVEFFVNGQSAGFGTPGSFFTLWREWNTGDTLTFALPMALRVEKYIGMHRLENAGRYALLYGPLLLGLVGPHTPGVFQSPEEPTTLLPFAAEELPGRLEQKENLTFVLPGTDYCYKPYFLIREDEPFTCFPGFKES